MGAVPHVAYGGSGVTASFNVAYLNGVYTGITIAQGGSGFLIGETITLLGTVIQSTGATAFNNAIVTVAGVNAGGDVQAIQNLTQVPANRTPGTYSGVASTGGGGSTYNIIVRPAGGITSIDTFGAADASRPIGTYNGVAGTSSGSGTLGTFNVQVGAGGSILSITTVGIGSGNAIDDTITIADSALGAGGAADLTFDVASISTAGDVILNEITIASGGTGVSGGATITITDAVLGGGGGASITFDAQTVGPAGRISSITHTTSNAPQRSDTIPGISTYTSNTSRADRN